MSPELLIENLLAYAKRHLFLPEEDEIYRRNVLLSHFAFLRPIKGKRIRPKRKTPTCPTRSWARSRPSQRALILRKRAKRNALPRMFSGSSCPALQSQRSFFSPLRKRGRFESFRISILSLRQKRLCAKNRHRAQPQMELRRRQERARDHRQPLQTRKEQQGHCKAPLRAQGQQVPFLRALQGKRGLRRFCDAPAPQEFTHRQTDAGRRKVFLQYSPYAYYEEHCIAINEKHVPMHVDNKTPAKLLDFVDVLPNYFIGSNASLPSWAAPSSITSTSKGAST